MLVRVALIVILGIFNIALLGKVIWGPTGIMEYRNLKTQLLNLREKVNRLDAENRSLSREIRLLQSDGKYVEKMVRQRLHYLKDNEVVYIFASPETARNGVQSNDTKN